ncbi:WGxxGxxG family protein [Paenibacillus larvae]|uniref:Gram-positive cocci surface proteins LPxTG domain-containing protein n=3 Tax=Paenibacillus larvae TaxID=1464 RepID=V9WCE6_9BACL|nr:WGxxGxxG family protein [Paenibacillus larvae]AHD07390.1 hypothetical protein ERIC2_c36730 [Paenibacillus larvae subsp. larvae DSM 25430]AVF23731.1 hypothetical protein ERICI_04001 [Paenibacillus larvae subsp. larvae]AVF24857.1 hypothetical protein ERICIII_00638 [Paenibacillus larvae subsp. larvae]AVF29617.1 hypothetical protein ERICIV_00637 [Paenibacillus larvae subsp. larvae]AVG13953.1 hypothetical protein ERICII_03661 [Paenibacillus larvae subsp. larvae DSM 25430]
MRMKKLRSIALTAALVSSLAVGGAASANTAASSGNVSATPKPTPSTVGGYTTNGYNYMTNPNQYPSGGPYTNYVTGQGTPNVRTGIYGGYTGTTGGVNGTSNMMDRASTTGYTPKGVNANTYRPYTTNGTRTNTANYGWLGLLGLFGLAGFGGRNRERTRK